MATVQQFSLRWNQYLRHVTRIFDDLRTTEDLVDVTLCCEGKKVRAHKMLLSACSSYFREIFKENPCQHPVIIFKNVKFEDLLSIINFMYHGEVNVVQEQLASFLTTAELLEVQGLTDSSEDKSEDSVSEVEFVKDVCLQGSEEVPVVTTAQSRKRKAPYEESEQLWNDGIGNLTDLGNMNTDCNMKLEQIEVYENKSQTEHVNPSGSMVLSTQDKEISNLDMMQGSNVLNESKSTEITQPTSDDTMQDLANDSVLKEATQDGDMGKFRCHVCWKGFKHPTSLTLHKDSHTGKTQCPVCNRLFSRSYDMRSHLMKIHQEQTIPDNR